MNFPKLKRLLALAMVSGVWLATPANGGTLVGSVANVATGTSIDLTAAGPVDWVHWGTYTEFASDRKAGVTPQIGSWTSVGSDNKGDVFIYQYSGNSNGYTWFDGVPATMITNTDTGVWAYKDINPNTPQDTI